MATGMLTPSPAGTAIPGSMKRGQQGAQAIRAPKGKANKESAQCAERQITAMNEEDRGKAERYL
jgi:hypothetical protein